MADDENATPESELRPETIQDASTEESSAVPQAPAETDSHDVPAAPSETTEPATAAAESAPAVDAAHDESADTPVDDKPKPIRPLPSRHDIKIGSQRDDAATVAIKAKPQNLTTPAAPSDSVGEQTGGPQPTSGEKAEAFPPPRIEQKLSDELQREVDEALGNVSIDELIGGGAASTTQDELEEGAKLKGTVLSVRNDNVFVDLARRNQGIVSLKQFAEPPEAGTSLEVVVNRFDPEEGIYELLLPDAAVDVAGWDELSEGMVVEAVISGHNKGGLECEVNKIRGFIPVSQVALYRVENLEEFVGQRFSCVVTEVKPQRRNLVLSRRAMLERERAEAKQKLLEELEVGQTREGVVRRLQPFGAFVDIGGVDGLVHISQLSWDRIKDPSEVLTEGQTITVRISKIDPETGKIGLAYRDLWDNPWTTAADKYKPQTKVEGKVSKLTDFGAFVRLEPGVEGLIHISELAHRRVFRSSDVLSEGEDVEVMILSVDEAQQRISLSLKALEERPVKESKTKDEPPEMDESPAAARRSRPKNSKLKGGFDRPTGGEDIGLKW